VLLKPAGAHRDLFQRQLQFGLAAIEPDCRAIFQQPVRLCGNQIIHRRRGGKGDHTRSGILSGRDARKGILHHNALLWRKAQPGGAL
jgi:hypothetical protein